MTSADKVRKEINAAVSDLISTGLCDDQNYAFLRSGRAGASEVTFPNRSYVSEGMRSRDYQEVYDVLREARAYTAKLADGALMQLAYQFDNGEVCRHRLAFWPSPYLHDFQADPEIYINDEIFAEVVERGVVPFPVRFDFEADDRRHEEVSHPKCHLTLGQYKRCRIPVSAPLAPVQFVDFVLRNFYNSAHASFSDALRLTAHQSFAETIVDRERAVVHVQVPQLGK